MCKRSVKEGKVSRKGKCQGKGCVKEGEVYKKGKRI